MRPSLHLLAPLLTVVVACAAGEAPRCDGNVLVRPPNDREAVEGGYTEGDGFVHLDCGAGAQCVEANDTAECVQSPLTPCTADACGDLGLVRCGATGYVAGEGFCEGGTACASGEGWAACVLADVPCDVAGAWFCRDGVPYQCGDHGLASDAREACTDGYDCVEAIGVSFCALRGATCPEDAYAVCHEGRVATCVQGTSYILSERECDAGLTCVESVAAGQPTADCQ